MSSLPPRPSSPVTPGRTAVSRTSSGANLPARPGSITPMDLSLPPKPVTGTTLPPTPGSDSATNVSYFAPLTSVPDEQALSSNSHPQAAEGGSSGLGSRTGIPESGLGGETDCQITGNGLKRKQEQDAPGILDPTSPPLSAIVTMSADTYDHLPPSTSISTLPLPLPSKRFKKAPATKAVLIPVEQLPVFPLPPPPPITDPELLQTVFTHSSMFEKSRGRFEDPPPSGAKHYEKLEHVGDSLLGMVVTTWLHELRPRLTCGTASKLKAHLVSNATLSHLSGLYNFPQRLRGANELLPILRAQTDVRAAIVEAYIAGVYFSFPPEERFSKGLGVIDRWLREMYEPLYDFFLTYMKSEYEQHHLSITFALDGSMTILTEDEMARIDSAAQGMSNLLQMYCQRQDKQCRYEEERYETHCGILWRMRLFVDGVPVGEATRSGRRMAKNVAAWEACKRFGLVDKGESDNA